jgi:hypothetical protein
VDWYPEVILTSPGHGETFFEAVEGQLRPDSTVAIR